MLAELAVAAGRSKMSIAAAKTWLRGGGDHGAALARRLSRLSKGRKVAAHPDVSLIADIRSFAASPPLAVPVSVEDVLFSGEESAQEPQPVLVKQAAAEPRSRA